LTRPEDDEIHVEDEPEDDKDVSKMEAFEERMEAWEHRAQSPKDMKRKGTVSAILGVAWIGFVIVWLFFFAVYYTLAENIAIILASMLLLLGMTNAVMWGPPEWRVRLSGILGIGWVTFIILWLPFYRNFGIPFYQGYATLILSFVILSAVLGGSWLTIVPKSGWKPSRIRVGAATVIFYGWLCFLMFWLWFYADA
jgi:hypothetical protein